MKKKAIPCGRTVNDRFLCCTRKHRWWNIKWIYENGWNCYCRKCGHIIAMTSEKNLKDVKWLI